MSYAKVGKFANWMGGVTQTLLGNAPGYITIILLAREFVYILFYILHLSTKFLLSKSSKSRCVGQQVRFAQHNRTKSNKKKDIAHWEMSFVFCLYYFLFLMSVMICKMPSKMRVTPSTINNQSITLNPLKISSPPTMTETSNFTRSTLSFLLLE